MWKVAQKSYAPQSDAANAKPRTSGDVCIACNVKFVEAWTSASIELSDRAANVKPALHEHRAVCNICLLQHALGDSWQDSHSAKTGVRK